MASNSSLATSHRRSQHRQALFPGSLPGWDAKKLAEKHQSLRRACAAACDIDVTVAEQLERWPAAVTRMRQALLDLER